MKKGDKVILEKFKSSDVFIWSDNLDKFVGKEVKVSEVDNEDETFFISEISCWWLQSSCEPIKNESQEYFYVGQTVYSPLFRNKERKAIITKINKDISYPILCEGDNVYHQFTLEGLIDEEEDFISLFQEPIQFPTNKPIERFEEGEIVEVSDNGIDWFLRYFVKMSTNSKFPYTCSSVKTNDKLVSFADYSKIRKIK